MNRAWWPASTRRRAPRPPDRALHVARGFDAELSARCDTRAAIDSLADYSWVIAEFTLEGRLDQISCPTLACAAEADPLSGPLRQRAEGL